MNHGPRKSYECAQAHNPWDDRHRVEHDTGHWEVQRAR